MEQMHIHPPRDLSSQNFAGNICEEISHLHKRCHLFNTDGPEVGQCQDIINSYDHGVQFLSPFYSALTPFLHDSLSHIL